MESTSRLKRPAKSIIEYESDNDDLIEIQSQEDNSENEQISKSIKKSKGPARKSLITAAKSTENDHPNLARISSLKSISSSSTTMKRKSSSFEKEQNENNDDDIDVDADAEYTKKPKSNGMLDNLLEGLESSQADDDELLADEIPDTAKGVDDANKKDKSEAGQIVQIKIEHFMCHQKLTVDFCKNVNFITGQNGSGMLT